MYLKKKVNRIIFIISLLSIILWSSELYGQINEYEIKASFLFKFGKYTEWPKYDDDFFIITVIGRNPFADSLKKVAATKTIKEKKIKIRFINSINEIGNSNILFIPKTEKKNIENIIKATQNKPILLISESCDAAVQGTHINFYLNNENKIRFEISKKNLKKSNLKVSSLLLDIGTEID